jgi:D-alanyl-D-alanine carboxypeptidase/D-alanyl-D-alanine-endopeptidase (penicillin-binding protein 4)
LLGLALLGCGATAHHHDHGDPTARLKHSAPAGRAVKPPPQPSPALVRLRRAVLGPLHAAGSASGAVIYDITAQRPLLTVRGDVARAPASVEKLYTSVAVLTDLGPDATLSTTVLGAGHPAPRGVWHGDLYLRGGGDPTFGDGTFNRIWEEGYGPTAEELAAQLYRLGIRRVTGSVIGDASLFDPRRGGPSTGFAPDIPDIGGQLSALTYDHGSTLRRLSPGAFAARELALTLRHSGIRAKAATRTHAAPADARPLAVVRSPPVSVLLKLTDVPSDDFFAEMLTKQLGVRYGAGGSTTAGASVIAQVLARYGLTPAIVDGSGLSRADRTSPTQVVELLRAVWHTSIGDELLAALPVVGISGTVARIGVHTPAQGRCRAKTGTLDYVTNLAGYCSSRGGHVLAFAVFLDGPTNLRGRLLLSRMIAGIARY